MVKLTHFRDGLLAQADTLEAMRQLPTGRFQAVITSPPYNIRNSSGNGLKNNAGGRWRANGLHKGYNGHADNMPHGEYVAWQRECLSEMMRLIADDGAIFWNHTRRVQNGLEQNREDILEGFPVRQQIIWDRGSGLNFNAGYFVPTTQDIYLIAKDGFKLAPKANAYGDIWKARPDFANDHPAPMPVEIAERCARSVGRGAILDPFMGSGTTALGARKAGLKWCGIEQAEEYCDMAKERLA